MNWKAIGLIGGIAAAGYFAIRYFAGGIRYNFTGIKMRGFQGLNLKLSLFYTIENVNDIPATVTNLKGRLLYGGYQLNTIDVVQPVTIPPGGRENMEVQFTISPGKLLAEILQFFEKKEGFKTLTMKGTLTGKIGQVPFVYLINEPIRIAE